MALLAEYKRSLKMQEAEEVFDLLIYRPLAFACVRVLGKTPVTPNQVTLVSLLCGVFAAWMYGGGNPGNFFTAAMVYAAANVLDCADGQLARLKNNGTLLGRVLDGAADYVGGVAIFLGLGYGLSGGDLGTWITVLLAGICTAIHAMFFDHYQSEFISAVRSERNFLERETEQFSSEVGLLRARGANRLRIFVLSVYIRYLHLQHVSSTKKHRDRIDPQVYRNENVRVIRFWSFLGPTTNRTALIVSSCFGRPDLYIWAVLILGNLWLAICFFLQRRVHLKLAALSNLV